MKPEELRIGNWVESNGFYRVRGPYQVSSISGVLEYDYIKPLPLTEEWLLKFGFKKDKTWTGDVFENKKGDRVCLGAQMYVASESVKVDCPKNVHQLQNLYYALTGEELKIKDASTEEK